MAANTWQKRQERNDDGWHAGLSALHFWIKMGNPGYKDCPAWLSMVVGLHGKQHFGRPALVFFM
jgi:hypothetical protein